MFKSVFAKYITVFMVLIVVSFAMLLAIISTVVNNYSVNAKADLVAQSAHTASAYIEEKLQQADMSDFVEFSRQHEADISLMMQAVASTSEDFTQSVLRIRWPEYWSFSFSISPFNDYLGLISDRKSVV